MPSLKLVGEKVHSEYIFLELGFDWSDWVLMWQENLFAVGFDWVLYRSLFAHTDIPILYK